MWPRRREKKKKKESFVGGIDSATLLSPHKANNCSLVKVTEPSLLNISISRNYSFTWTKVKFGPLQSTES